MKLSSFKFNNIPREPLKTYAEILEMFNWTHQKLNEIKKKHHNQPFPDPELVHNSSMNRSKQQWFKPSLVKKWLNSISGT